MLPKNGNVLQGLLPGMHMHKVSCIGPAFQALQALQNATCEEHTRIQELL